MKPINDGNRTLLVTADDADRVSWALNTKKESIRIQNDGHRGENKSGQAN